MVTTFLCKNAAAAPKAGVLGLTQRYFSANAKVWVDKDTRVICQGITGKQVRPLCLCF
jgi:succinyl-CoA synthetase alpha subunit